MCLKIVESDDPSGTPVGAEFCYELQEINQSHLRFKWLETGQEFTEYRLPSGTPSCPVVKR